VLFCTSMFRPTTSRPSRTMLDYMLCVFYVTTWHSRILMCYRGQRFHSICYPLSTSEMKRNDGYVIWGILDINKVSSVAYALMQVWQRRRIDLINLPKLLVGYCSRYGPNSRAYGSYDDFLDKGLLLTRKLLNQWFLVVNLKSSLRKFG
jgi:hypothetical protein